MMAIWMVYSMLIGALLAIGAATLERAARGTGRSTRAIWLVAMLASLLATAAVSLRSIPPEKPPALPPVAAAEHATTVATAPPAQFVAPYEAVALQPPLPSAIESAHVPSLAERLRSELPSLSTAALAGWFTARRDFSSIDQTLLLIWGTMSSVVLLLIVASILRLNRRRNSWRRSSYRGTPLLVTDGIGPAVVGIVRSEIAVPTWLFDMEAEKQQLVIEHERQHLLARDQVAMLGGLLVAALLPWNATLWFMLRRLRRSTEMDCDIRVLRAHPTPREYATLLVDIGARFSPRALASPALADSPSDLECRVNQILSGSPRVTGWSAAARLLFGGLIVLAACMTPRPVVSITRPATEADRGQSDSASVQTATARDSTSVASQVSTAGVVHAVSVASRVSVADVAQSATVPATRGAAAQVQSQANATAKVAVAQAAGAQTAVALRRSAASALQITAAAASQSSAMVVGTVLTGTTRLPGASVTLLDDSSRVVDTTTSDAIGEFTLLRIPPASEYRLRVQRDGFVEFLSPAFTLNRDSTGVRRTLAEVRIVLQQVGAPAVAAGAERVFSITQNSITGGRGVAGGRGRGSPLPTLVGNVASRQAAGARGVAQTASGRGVAQAAGGRGVAQAASGRGVARPTSSLGGRQGGAAVSGASMGTGTPPRAAPLTAGGGRAVASGAGRGAVAGGGRGGIASSIGNLLSALSPPIGSSYGGVYGVLRFGTPTRTITSDSLVQLVAARYPQLFTDTVRSDSLMVALALDARGDVTHTRLLNHSFAVLADDGVSMASYSDSTSEMRSARNVVLNDIFPDLAGQRRLASGLLKGPVTPRGLATRRITLIFTVMTPR
jgi:beta-lactamase regulating signal transducer with metallopeptidase domain